MECKRDGLASIGEALSSLDGPGGKPSRLLPSRGTTSPRPTR